MIYVNNLISDLAKITSFQEIPHFLRLLTLCQLFQVFTSDVVSRSSRGVFDKTLCDKVCQWLATGGWFSPPIKLTVTVELKYCWKRRQHYNRNPLCSKVCHIVPSEDGWYIKTIYNKTSIMFFKACHIMPSEDSWYVKTHTTRQALCSKADPSKLCIKIRENYIIYR